MLFGRRSIVLRYTRGVHSLSREFLLEKIIFACKPQKFKEIQDCKKATGVSYLHIIIRNYYCANRENE